MTDLKLSIDGSPSDLAALQAGDRVLVPVEAFAAAVGAYVRHLGEGGPLTVCQGDLCVPLDRDGQETVQESGTTYAPLAAFGDLLGLRWAVADGRLEVQTGLETETVGTGPGAAAPDFSLPDLYTGEQVALRDYRGRKAVFYVWASW